MEANDTRNYRIKGTIYVLIATLFWGSSFLVTQGATSSFPTAMLVSIRMAIGGLFVAFLCRKHHCETTKKLLGISAVLAVLYSAGMILQTEGLRYTSSGKSAFLTDAYCVYVPYLEWKIIGKKPTLKNVITGILCLIGVGFVALTESFSIEYGDLLSLIASLCFGLCIVLMAKYVKEYDAALINMYESLISCVLLAVISAMTETIPAKIELDGILRILYLGIFCSGIALLCRSKSLETISPTRATLIGSFEPVFAVALAAIVASEKFTARCIIGFTLILLSVVLDSIDFNKNKRLHRE